MSKSIDKIAEALDVAPESNSSTGVEHYAVEPVNSSTDLASSNSNSALEKISEDVEKDYNVQREVLHRTIVNGEKSLNSLMALAGDLDSPRAYEVIAQLLKQVSDSALALSDLHKKTKSLVEESPKKEGNRVQNNNLFITTTKDLLKQLKNMPTDCEEEQDDGRR